jgi:hypothetical protein
MTLHVIDHAPIARPKVVDAHVSELFDFALARGEQGFTHLDAQAALGWNRNQFSHASRKLREILKGEPVNLVCSQESLREPWVYRLTGEQGPSREWQSNRLLDAETRLETIEHVAASLVQATDARSLEGRRARIIQRGVGRTLEDLADLHSQAS